MPHLANTRSRDGLTDELAVCITQKPVDMMPLPGRLLLELLLVVAWLFCC